MCVCVCVCVCMVIGVCVCDCTAVRDLICLVRFSRDRPPRRGYDDGPRYRDPYDYDRRGPGSRRRSPPPDYDRRREEPVERPRLQLQPRSKPVEEPGKDKVGGRVTLSDVMMM